MSTYTVTPPPDPRPPLPIPNIPLLLTRIGATASALLPADLLKSYHTTTLQHPVLTPTQTQTLLNTLQSTATNWSTHWFLEILLSTRWPVPTSTRLTLLLTLPPPLTTRTHKVAALLRAVAVWTKEYILPGGTGIYNTAQKRLKWQLRGLCAAFRVPITTETCALQYADPALARYAVVWHRGWPWRIELVDSEGAVFSADAIDVQLRQVLESALGAQAGPLLAAVSWRLDRAAWCVQRAAYAAVPGNEGALGVLYGSLVSAALEEEGAPEGLAEKLNGVRTGGGSENRFADQTLTVVSYSDGTTGLSFDHAPSDCGPAMELATLLANIAATPTNTPTSPLTPPPATPITILPPLNLPQLPPAVVEPIPRTVKALTLPPPPSPRLTDTLLNLALQATLISVSPTGAIPPIWQPVLLRDFRYGRCDEMMPVTPESVAFARLVHAAAWESGVGVEESGSEEEEEGEMQQMQNAFKEAWRRRRELIKQTQDGLTTKYFQQGYLHPFLELVAPSIDAAVMDVFRGVNAVPAVQFTGFAIDDGVDEEGAGAGVEAGLSNIYMEDQLVVFYLQRAGRVVVMFSGTGVWRGVLEREGGGWVQRVFEGCYGVIRSVAEGMVF
ncbi:uncharacterized protein LAJ45_07334 [Morchella importuna]|uniref:uncharacterized protein n=1 Tax=Morchella importuna TaxID=1174673 RepID=UPI001E8E26BD|nr:uncharacterized protein LAJ45_07334 [Morchella importuna]KAH8148623.1 hypothetical protein LAJ45_07334 [Morchella importuna]